MRNRLFVPDFLLDFYTVTGSIDTPARSNGRRPRTWKISSKTDSAGLSCAGQKLAANGSNDTSWSDD